jgi:cytochrome c-type biogenesis protein CcmH/NrfG
MIKCLLNFSIAVLLVISFMSESSLRAGSVSATPNSPKDLLEAGRVDEVIKELNGRLSSTPTDAESANLLCRAYFELEDWNRAEPSCKKAASLDPGNSRFHLWLGRVYGEKADRANFLTAMNLAGKVRGEFERAVQLNPSDIDARLDLAEFYLEAPGIVGGGEDRAREQAK